MDFNVKASDVMAVAMAGGPDGDEAKSEFVEAMLEHDEFIFA
jgi:hypothetical protein